MLRLTLHIFWSASRHWMLVVSDETHKKGAFNGLFWVRIQNTSTFKSSKDLFFFETKLCETRVECGLYATEDFFHGACAGIARKLFHPDFWGSTSKTKDSNKIMKNKVVHDASHLVSLLQSGFAGGEQPRYTETGHTYYTMSTSNATNRAIEPFYRLSAWGCFGTKKAYISQEMPVEQCRQSL